MGPKCAPRNQLSNHKVWSESGQWRPDWWRKYVLEKTLFLQPPCKDFHCFIWGKTSHIHIHLKTKQQRIGKLSGRILGCFGGLPGPRGGQKRILNEKLLPVQGSRLESVPWGPVSWPSSFLKVPQRIAKCYVSVGFPQFIEFQKSVFRRPCILWIVVDAVESRFFVRVS